MTDSELTRLAFKAVFSGADINHDKDMLKRWSPLTDDGDALRLAVKLNITVSNSEQQKHACASSIKVSGICLNTHNGNPYAATRRAIVRAAAEIGKSINP